MISSIRAYPGRPPLGSEVESLILRFARENSSWGYDRIAGAMINFGHSMSDQTVGYVPRRHGIAPAPKCKQTTTGKKFIRRTWPWLQERISLRLNCS
jgi:hypothetical protein